MHDDGIAANWDLERFLQYRLRKQGFITVAQDQAVVMNPLY